TGGEDLPARARARPGAEGRLPGGPDAGPGTEYLPARLRRRAVDCPCRAARGPARAGSVTGRGLAGGARRESELRALSQPAGAKRRSGATRLGPGRGGPTLRLPLRERGLRAVPCLARPPRLRAGRPLGETHAPYRLLNRSAPADQR